MLVDYTVRSANGFGRRQAIGQQATNMSSAGGAEGEMLVCVMNHCEALSLALNRYMFEWDRLPIQWIDQITNELDEVWVPSR